MEKIIAVKPVPEYFSFTWMLGSRCNYDCMYCSSELHDDTSRPHSLDVMQKVWHNVYDKTKHKNLPYKVTFTGGEVTANKNFFPLVKWLRSNFDIDMINFTTNGSASKTYYEEISKYVESISFSTHSEFFDESKFFDTVIAIDKLMIRPKKSVHVNVMDEYWNQDRIKIYQSLLERHKISYSINEINYANGTRTYFLKKGKLNLEV